MPRLLRTNTHHPDFTRLNKILDAELAIRDGKDHSFYAQYNKVDDMKFIVLAFDDKEAVGCGAIKEYESGIIEIKRMFVPLEHRGKGIAVKVLVELEKWAAELGFSKCILETGFKQPEAIALYKKCSYSIIPNYGQYNGVETSVCFEKVISSQALPDL